MPKCLPEYGCLIVSSWQTVPSYLAPGKLSFHIIVLDGGNGKGLDYGSVPEDDRFHCQSHCPRETNLSEMKPSSRHACNYRYPTRLCVLLGTLLEGQGRQPSVFYYQQRGMLHRRTVCSHRIGSKPSHRCRKR